MTDLATDTRSEAEERSLALDAELLREAQRQLGTESPDVAVSEALRRLVDQERKRRRAALEELWRMHDEGRFDYSQLEAADE